MCGFFFIIWQSSYLESVQLCESFDIHHDLFQAKTKSDLKTETTEKRLRISKTPRKIGTGSF